MCKLELANLGGFYEITIRKNGFAGWFQRRVIDSAIRLLFKRFGVKYRGYHQPDSAGIAKPWQFRNAIGFRVTRKSKYRRLGGSRRFCIRFGGRAAQRNGF